MEEIGEHRQDHAGLRHQLLGLEALRVRQCEPVLGSVEQPAERSVQGVGHERGLERVRLQQHREAGERALLDRRRSEEHTSELQSLMRISYAVFCLKKKKNIRKT